jgi:Ca-activated chloride channel family protein
MDGTNLHDGLTLGRDEVLRTLTAGTVNRVILLSDGNANVGVTDIPSLARVASDASERGVRITTVGLGLDYNEDLMEQVADHGRGQYYYVKDAATLEPVFAGELRAIQGTVATAAELRLEPTCAGVEILEVVGYPTRRDGQATVVPLADLAGGDKRKVVARLKVPTAELGAEQVLRASLSFTPSAGGARKSVVAALGVEVTRDAVAVEGSIDPAVAGQIAQIESSQTVRQAAEAYQSGDQKAAMRILSLGRAKMNEQAKYAPADVKQAEEQMDGVGAGFANNAPTSAAAPAMTKAAKKMASDLAK